MTTVSVVVLVTFLVIIRWNVEETGTEFTIMILLEMFLSPRHRLLPLAQGGKSPRLFLLLGVDLLTFFSVGENRKFCAHEQACREAGISFVPLVESFGG